MQAKANRPDIHIDNAGSIYLFTPLTSKGLNWIRKNVHADPWQCFGASLAVEHGYAMDIADGMQADGLRVV